VVDHSYAQWLHPGNFTQPAYGSDGNNLGRNQIIGPGLGDADRSLLKNPPLWCERVKAQFRVAM
jgi:hypothetical protein